jgi:Zn finger protein HypA/HybF involved in hydrogenase expression
MHDTILLNKISEAVTKVCAASKIKKVKKLAIVVSNTSHVNENNLYDHLQYMNGDLVGDWTELRVQKDDILEQTAILHSIQGEQEE